MAEKQTVASTADEVRKILAAAKAPLTTKEIYELCDTATSTTQVAGILHGELKAERVERDGTAGAYAYSMADAGRSAAANPNALRSHKHRRTRGRGVRKATNLAKVIAAAGARKPKRATRAPRTPAAITTPVPDEEAQRLAAAVIAQWPEPLDAMPADLRARVDRTLARGVA